jgi:hypothetical protein
MRKKPTIRVTKLSETINQTKWLVDWVYPPNSGKWGKSYRATTYPDCDLIFLQTAAKQRTVAKGVATKIMPQIRAALATLGAVQ